MDKQDFDSFAQECLQGLTSPHPFVRYASAWNLWVCGDVRVVPGIARHFNSVDPETLHRILRTIRDFGPHAQEALPQVLDILTSPEYLPDIYPELFCIPMDMALAAVATIGDAAVNPLIELSRHPDKRLRHRAVVGLGGVLWSESSPIQALCAALHDPERWVRFEAVHGLCIQGERAHEAIPSLLRALPIESDPLVRAVADYALAQLCERETDRSSITTILGAARGEPWDEFFKSLEAFTWIGKDAELAFDILFDSLRRIEPTAMPPHELMAALLQRGAVYTFERLQETGLWYHVGWLAQAVGKLGRRGREAEGELRNLLTADDPSVREIAVGALWKVGFGKTTASALLPLLHDPSPGVRREVAIALAYSPPGSRGQVVEALTRALTDAEPIVRFHAESSLWSFGAEPV